MYKTKQRDILLACIKNFSNKHVTIDEIVEILKKGNTPVGKSTVYRYLNKLVADGLVRKSMNNDGIYEYEYFADCECSYHLKCNDCGSLIHAHDNTPNQISNIIENLYNFQIDNTKTIFYGKCKNCI